jgi:AraC-like DNA-binding protein
MQAQKRKSRDLTHADDVLSSSLRALHVSGTLLLREAYSSPWAVTIPDAEALRAMFQVKPGTRVVAFHLVEFGHCEVQTAGGAAELLQAGEMMICFGGEAHRICAGQPSQAQTVEALLAGEPNAQHPDASGRPAAAALICGVFFLQHSALNPLLAALPALMRAELSQAGELSNLSGVARLMAQEMSGAAFGRSYVVERLLEVLCAQAIRAYLASAPGNAKGWTRAIQDPIVGRAMAMMHAQPGVDWSIASLAGEVAMSPSRFAARFALAVEDSPMAYLTKLRMAEACRMLASSQVTIEQIASDVGYESAAAFNRTFRKHLGQPPGSWRSREMLTATAHQGSK